VLGDPILYLDDRSAEIMNRPSHYPKAVRGISCCHEFAHGYDHQTFKWHHHAAAVAVLWMQPDQWRRQLLDRRGGGFLASFLGLWTVRGIFLSGSLAFPLPVATLSFLPWAVSVKIARLQQGWILAWAGGPDIIRTR